MLPAHASRRGITNPHPAPFTPQPVLYDVFDFIESAISAGGNVLVHCSQGVSRSTALAIAYMMWKHGHSYEDTFNVVKQARGVANPNIGFTCQLLHWHKRRMQALAPLHGPRPVSPATQQPLPRARLYRIAAFSVHNPTYLVAKPGPTSPGVSALDTRGIFVVHTAAKVYIWVGRRARQDYLGPALRAATQLAKYEASRHAQGGRGADLSLSSRLSLPGAARDRARCASQSL